MDPFYARQLKLLSPSQVGRFALCPQRLIAEVLHPEWETPSGPAADYGTVCHYETQKILGVPPDKAPTPEQIANAHGIKLLRNRQERFKEFVAKASATAARALPAPPPGVTWMSEVRCLNPAFLPLRVGRKGDVGFGGSMDLVYSDRSWLFDLKFPGELPTEAKLEYVWQLGCYHAVSGIQKTSLVFVPPDGSEAAMFTIDWGLPAMRELASSMQGFIHFAGHPDFWKYAWFMPGEACTWCERNPKKWNRKPGAEICPMHMLPNLVDVTRQPEEPPCSPADLIARAQAVNEQANTADAFSAFFDLARQANEAGGMAGLAPPPPASTDPLASI